MGTDMAPTLLYEHFLSLPLTLRLPSVRWSSLLKRRPEQVIDSL